jgi:hypothetical protein
MAQIGVNTGDYIFDASLKTITFTGVTVDTVDQIKLVNNVTDGIILFNPIDPTKLGVLAANVLTLAFDTTTMSDTDDLFICVNLLEDALATEATLAAVEAQTALLDFTPSGGLLATLEDSETGAKALIDNNQSIKTAEVMVLCGGVLTGEPLSPILWSELSINGGALTGGAGEQILSTGTAANGEFILQTKKRSRFIITQYNINHIGIQLLQADLLDPNTIFEWGSIDFIDDTGVTNILNPTPNGICFRVTGGATPTWEIVSSKNGVETAIDSSLWNGPSAGNLNKTPDLSVYETRYNAGSALFFQGPNFLHKLGGLVSTYAATYDFPVAVRIRNINGNTTDRKVATRASGAYRLGEERGELISRAFTVDTLIKSGAGYIGTAALSRTGSSGGSGTAELYDGVDATGELMGRIDVGGDDVKGIALNGTYSIGLYIALSGTGTNTLNINFE